MAAAGSAVGLGNIWRFPYFAALVPSIILPYYCAIGGWIIKYMVVFITRGSEVPAADGYFGGFITTDIEPVIWVLSRF